MFLVLRKLRNPRAAREQAVDGQRPHPAEDQRDQARDVQEIDLVTRRAELRPLRGQPDRIDGAEAILERNPGALLGEPSTGAVQPLVLVTRSGELVRPGYGASSLKISRRRPRPNGTCATCGG